MNGEIIIPNAVVAENDATYKARTIRYKNHRADFGNTAIFSMDGKGYVIGQEAEDGRPSRITGPAKYRKGYLDLMMLAALQKLLPDGHSNIIVGCAHTTDSTPYIEAIANAIQGKHDVVRYDGRPIRYVVRGMIPWDEPAGGLLRFMTRPYHEYNSEDIQIDDKILVVDIGGKISSITPAIILPGMRVQVFWSRGESIDLGVQDVIKTLTEELPSLYPDQFKSKTISPRILREALRNQGVTKIKNVPTEVHQAVINATGKLLDRLDKYVIDHDSEVQDTNHIVVTGGGGGLLFNAIKDEVFKHGFVYMADDPETINFANLRGGEYAVSVWVTENGGKVPVKKDPPVYLVLDPGNSDIKAKLVGGGGDA